MVNPMKVFNPPTVIFVGSIASSVGILVGVIASSVAVAVIMSRVIPGKMSRIACDRSITLVSGAEIFTIYHCL